MTTALPIIPEPPPTFSKGAVPKGVGKWFAIKRGQQSGPWDDADLLAKLQSGEFHERTFVWRATMEKWVRFNEISALSDVLDKYRDWLKTQDEPTRVVDNPLSEVGRVHKGPKDNSFSEIPQVRPSRVMSLESLQPGALADDLYDGLGTPSIDIRKAREVQPEEPEIRSRSERARIASESRKKVQRQQGQPAFVADEGDWPSSEAFTTEQAIRYDEYDDITDIDDQVSPVKEFSVMAQRMGSSMHKRNMIKLGALIGGGVLVVGGIVAALMLGRADDELAREISVIEERTYDGKPRVVKEDPRKFIPMPKSTILESDKYQGGPSGHPSYADKGQGDARRSNAEGRQSPEVSDYPSVKRPDAPKLAELDPTVRNNFKRYGGLIDSKRTDTEPVVEVKPSTLNQMNGKKLDNKFWNEFFQRKMKKFSECKYQAVRPTDLPVRLALSFKIDSSGALSSINVSAVDGANDNGINRCVRSVIQEWQFPAQDESSTFKTTLSL